MWDTLLHFCSHLSPTMSWFLHYIFLASLKKKFLLSLLSSWLNFSSWAFLLITYTPDFAFPFFPKYFSLQPPFCHSFHIFFFCFTNSSLPHLTNIFLFPVYLLSSNNMFFLHNHWNHQILTSTHQVTQLRCYWARHYIEQVLLKNW